MESKAILEFRNELVQDIKVKTAIVEAIDRNLENGSLNLKSGSAKATIKTKLDKETRKKLYAGGKKRKKIASKPKTKVKAKSKAKLKAKAKVRQNKNVNYEEMIFEVLGELNGDSATVSEITDIALEKGVLAEENTYTRSKIRKVLNDAAWVTGRKVPGSRTKKWKLVTEKPTGKATTNPN